MGSRPGTGDDVADRPVANNRVKLGGMPRRRSAPVRAVGETGVGGFDVTRGRGGARLALAGAGGEIDCLGALQEFLAEFDEFADDVEDAREAARLVDDSRDVGRRCGGARRRGGGNSKRA